MLKNIFTGSIYILLSLGLFLQCTPPDIAIPILESLEPSEVEIGESVTLKGKFMDHSVSLIINGEESLFSPADLNSKTELRFTAPRNLAVGAYDLYVTSVSGNSNSLLLKIVPPRPIISSVSKEMGMPGDTVIVCGENLTTEGLVIELAGLLITDFEFTPDGCISFSIPEVTETVSGQLKLSVDGRASAERPFTIKASITAPVMLSITPDEGAVGDTILIKGEDLSGDEVKVFFPPSLEGNILMFNDSSISVVVPEEADEGRIFLQVQVDGENSNELPFVVTPDALPTRPTLSSIRPDTVGLGSALEVSGFNLEGADLKLFYLQGNSVYTRSVNNISPGVLLDTIPVANFQFGPIQVYVEVDGEKSDTLTVQFIPPPRISDINNNNPVSPGQTISINGDYFYSSDVERVRVEFASTGARVGTILGLNPQRINVRVPLDVISGDLTIETRYGSVSTPLQIQSLSKITTMLPRSNGPNYPLFIYGQAMDQVDEIRFANISIGLNEFTYSPACKCLGLNIPDGVQLATIPVQTGVNGNFSSPFYYTINSSLAPIARGGSPIIIPTPPPGVSLGDVQNQWVFARGPQDASGLDSLGASSFDLTSSWYLRSGSTIPDTAEWRLENPDLSFPRLGFYAPTGDTLTLRLLDGTEYFGKQDGSFLAQPEDTSDTGYDRFYGGAIPRIILTPFESGKQVELIFPYATESASAMNSGSDYLITVNSRFFSPNQSFDNYSFSINDSSYTADVGTFISVREIQLRIAKNKINLAPGTYDFRIDDLTKVQITLP